MEASTTLRKKIGGRRPSDVFSSRRNAIIVAVIAALFAGILLFAFVQQYKHNSSGSVANTPVFFATGIIPRGTAFSEIASAGLYQRTAVKSSKVVSGAITDPAELQGSVAATEIAPGQQLTAADFTRTSVTIASQLKQPERAIAVPVDATHGLIGFVQAGDHVDMLANLGGRVSTLAENVLVLSAPTSTGGGGIGGGGNSNGNSVVVRVNATQDSAVAAASDDGKVWLVLRPPVGALK